jgi:flavodoxin
MNSIVIYATHTGNTRAIAEVIAGELESYGPVQLLPMEEAPAIIPEGTDLVVIGSPTEAHRMLPPAAQFFARLGPGALQGVAAAAFDTRLQGPRWLWGAAGAGIANALLSAGARVIAPAESFFVSMKPLLEPGEAERAATWARSLADAVTASAPVALAGVA